MMGISLWLFCWMYVADLVFSNLLIVKILKQKKMCSLNTHFVLLPLTLWKKVAERGHTSSHACFLHAHSQLHQFRNLKGVKTSLTTQQQSFSEPSSESSTLIQFLHCLLGNVNRPHRPRVQSSRLYSSHARSRLQALSCFACIPE